MINKKYKICIVADVPNWAFDNIAKMIKKELDYKYEIRIEYFNRRTEKDNFYEFLEKNNDCDLIHFLNRRTLLLMETDIFKEKVEKSGKVLKEYISQERAKISTAVNDHIDLTPEGIKVLKPIYNEYAKMYYTSSKKLFDIYNSIDEFRKPDTMIHDICDENVFKPNNLKRFEYDNIKDRTIVIGWVGNSIHSGQKDTDLKGFHSIIKPVIEELEKEKYNIKTHYADRNIVWRTTEEMSQYYSEIDMCLCTSIHEGTPLPVLESMYCGVPIISTDVGIVNEAFGKKQKEFVIGDRQNGIKDEEIKKLLKEKILNLYNNREKFKELSQENIKSIAEFDEGNKIKNFEKFFEKCLSK